MTAQFWECSVASALRGGCSPAELDLTLSQSEGDVTILTPSLCPCVGICAACICFPFFSSYISILTWPQSFSTPSSIAYLSIPLIPFSCIFLPFPALLSAGWLGTAAVCHACQTNIRCKKANSSHSLPSFVLPPQLPYNSSPIVKLSAIWWPCLAAW